MAIVVSCLSLIGKGACLFKGEKSGGLFYGIAHVKYFNELPRDFPNRRIISHIQNGSIQMVFYQVCVSSCLSSCQVEMQVCATSFSGLFSMAEAICNFIISNSRDL